MRHLINIERSEAESYYQWNRLLRNYVRNNALCMVAADFDAKLRKIRHVVLPDR